MSLDRPSPVRARVDSETRVPPRPAPPPPPSRMPRRPVLLAGFLLLLVVGCVSAWRGGSRDPADESPTGTAVAAGPTTTLSPTARSAAFDAAVGDTTGCQRLAGAEPQWLCPLPEGVVEYTQVASPIAAYRRIAGPDDTVVARGDAACANGGSEERAWSRPQAPATAAGRYLCRVVDARAELWWTVDDASLLGHASRRDDDLVALFSWWRSRTEGANDHP